MQQHFPSFTSEAQARQQGCFQCLQPFTAAPAIDDQFPSGRGQWRLVCSACGMSTWFDLLKAAA